MAELLRVAEETAALPAGMNLPEELQRREARRLAIAQAKLNIEARAQERFEREQAEYQTKQAARQAKIEATGKKPGGKEPKPPQAGPRPDDQINLTDEDSRIMKVAGVASSRATTPIPTGRNASASRDRSRKGPRRSRK